MNKLFKKVKNSFYPPKCPVCGARVMEDTRFCALCEEKIEPVPDMSCMGCGRGFDHCLCGADIDKGDYFKASAPFYYNDAMKEAVANIKFKKKLSGAAFLAMEMSKRAKAAFAPGEFDVIVPVPLGPLRHKKRGFNQCEIIGKTVSRELKVPMDTRAVKKWLETSAQSLLPAERRRENIEGAFLVTERRRVEGKRVLLLDDVITTKSTVNEVAKTLMEADAKSVHILALCVTKIVHKYRRRT